MWYLHTCVLGLVVINRAMDGGITYDCRRWSYDSKYSPRDQFWSYDYSRPIRLIVRFYEMACDVSSRLLQKASQTMEDMCTTVAIIDCSVRLLTMLEDRRSPPCNRFCLCDCSCSLRLGVRSSKIACNYRTRLALYRLQTGRKRSQAPCDCTLTEKLEPYIFYWFFHTVCMTLRCACSVKESLVSK